MTQDQLNAIIKVKKEIYEHIYYENRWIYVTLQALIEAVCKIYLSDKGAIFSRDENAYALIIKHKCGIVPLKDAFKTSFINVNKYANEVKHNTLQSKIYYERKLIGNFIEQFNDYCNELFGDNGKQFHLELETTKQRNKINVINSYKESLDIEDANRTNEDASEIVVVPCGVAKHDYGFTVHNLKKSDIKCQFQFKSVYATIFSIFQRGTICCQSRYIIEYEKAKKVKLNYKIIFRFQILILLMLKNNYFEDENLSICSNEGYNEELRIAVENINWFAQRISKLMDAEIPLLLLAGNTDPYTISIKRKSEIGVYCIDMDKPGTSNRVVWLEEPILYSLKNTEEVSNILVDFLFEFFKYREFKQGQKEALISLMKDNNNSIIVLPTGGGKSLIYYFISLLQPASTVIISPTEILIKDQIRNLREIYDINDVCSINESKNISDILKFNNKLVFLTPAQLQQKTIIKKLIESNVENQISSVILDEIHTISNWGHDFRPDYLMLSFNLLTYLDKPRYIGFTATANYKVIKDIIEQLSINYENIISPITMKRDNIDYLYLKIEDEKQYNKMLEQEIETIYSPSNTGKMIVFTKSKELGDELFFSVNDDMKQKIAVFSDTNEFSYEAFLKERKAVLISEGNIGIGIDIPLVQKTMHLGYPISKAQYVQELGRAGRSGEPAHSIVVYKPRKSLTRDELSLIDFNSSIDYILSTLKSMPDSSDIGITFKRILGHLEHYSVMAKGINELYEKLLDINNCIKLSFPKKVNGDSDSSNIDCQVILYFLYRMGIVYNWYHITENDQYVIYEIEVEHEKDNLEYIRSKCINYVSSLAEYNKDIFKIENASSVKEIIYIVQDWYYNQFMKYHREQFLNMIDFIELNNEMNCNQSIIQEQLQDYFTISLSSFKENQVEHIKSLTVREMIDTCKNNFDATIISNVEHSIENQYETKLDLFLCIYQLINHKYLNISRLERSLSLVTDSIRIEIFEILYLLYIECNSLEDKANLVNLFSNYRSESAILDNLFSRIQKDELYFFNLASNLTEALNKLIGDFNND